MQNQNTTTPPGCRLVRRQLSAVRSRSTPPGWSKVRLNPEALLAAGDSRQPSLSVCLDRAAPSRFSLSEFKEELVWRNKERVLLEHPSDNHDGVNPQHVHHQAGTEVLQIVGADYRIVVFGDRVVDARLVFQPVIFACLVHQGRFHARHKSDEGITGCRPDPSTSSSKASIPS